MKKLFYSSFLLLFLFFFSSPLFAWGPGAHIDYALHALSQVALYGSTVAYLLKKYPHDYLYGNIAADITIGKKFAGELYHCHYWEVVLPLYEKAQEESQRAFMLGYLTHLAVDTVSHNFFVPYKTIQSYDAYTLRHTYWEMRFDLKIPKEVWESIEGIANGSYEENDNLLRSGLKPALFSFGTTKKIFDSLLLLQRTKKWRTAADLLATRSSYPLPDAEVSEIKELCYASAIDFLRNQENSFVLRADPTGNLKLLYAKEMVSKIRKHFNRGLLEEEQIHQLIKNIRQSLKNSIYNTEALPDVYDVV